MVDNSLESVKLKLEKLRMGSVDEKTSSRTGEEKPGKEEKEQAKQQQPQMGLPLKVGWFSI